METSTLKFTRVRMLFRKSIFPESHPALNGEFEIARRAKQMEVIRHKQIVADQPGRCGVLPYAMQRASDGGLRQPTFALVSANSKKNPIWAAGRNVDTFSWRATAWIAKGNVCHVQIHNGGFVNAKDFSSRAMRA
jgi:hypothetical protein